MRVTSCIKYISALVVLPVGLKANWSDRFSLIYSCPKTQA